MLVAEYVGHEQFRVHQRTPDAPGPGQVQIAVAYVGICGTDLHVKHGHMDKRVAIPGPIGHEMSGTVAALGEEVTAFRVGDHVTVMPLQWCGQCPACRAGHEHVCQNLVFVGLDSAGAMQELWTVDQASVVPLPEDLSLATAALVEPMAVAVHDAGRARVCASDKVLVVGGGPIGLLIALVAKSRGADVVLSEPNQFRLAVAERLGVAGVDPGANDVLQVVEAWTGGAGVDVAFEVSGASQGLLTATHAARVRGRLVVVAIHSEPVPVDLFRVFWRELEVIGARVYERADFEEAVRLLAEGTIDAPVLISVIEPLARVSEAFAALDAGSDIVKVLLEVRR